MAKSQGFKIKYQLAAMAFEDPARFAATFQGESGELYLRRLWDALGADLAPKDRIPSAGASIDVDGGITLLRLPDARQRNEAYAVGVAFGSDKPRVFFLEKAQIPGLPHILAMVAEVGNESFRRNLGPVDRVDTAGFIEFIRDVVAEPSSTVPTKPSGEVP
jgi:hypothetical protein